MGCDRGSLVPALDGLAARCVGPWSRDKLHYIRNYLGLFSQAMHKKFPARHCVDLFSGPLMDRVGSNVKRTRQARGWTQAELARRVGISRIYVTQIEGATKECSLMMLGRLAKALRVKPDALLE